MKPTPAPRGVVAPTAPRHRAAPVAQGNDDGFDWGAPGIVAAVVAGFILLTLGGFAAAYRARVRPAR